MEVASGLNGRQMGIIESFLRVKGGRDKVEKNATSARTERSRNLGGFFKLIDMEMKPKKS